MYNQDRSIIVSGSRYISCTNFLSNKSGSGRGKGISHDEVKHQEPKQGNSYILLSSAKPSCDESKKLPLPGINPEHNELWNTVIEILENVATGLACREETSWFHSLIHMLDSSQDKEGHNVCDQTCKGKTFCAHITNFHQLIANHWMTDANGEEVYEAWSPEFMEAVKEATICITKSPEPKGRCEMNQVLLCHIGIFIILSKYV